ncbi:MAG: DEAD/DEAH box helicase, partial [Lentisphaeria bacterium]|nr:DEAD/DEAH box helicase [Lentisphaeria bacterium]
MISSYNQLILSAAPGAGKTTVIPPETAKLIHGKIRLVEPRRIAAKASAGRIAELDGSDTGTFSGYAVRGESKRSADTKILAVTPGILLREFQNDPALEDVEVIIFDEFHERSWECDLLLALALDIQESLRPDLKIILMSATLATEQLKNFLPG